MPFCTSCGAEITRTDASHCTSCGAEIPAEMMADAGPEAHEETPEQSRETRQAPPQQPGERAQEPTDQHAHSGRNEAGTRPEQPERRQRGDTPNSNSHPERSSQEQAHRQEQPRGSQQTASDAQTAPVDESTAAPSTTWRNVALGLSAIATLSILAFFALVMTSSPASGMSATTIQTMTYLLWAYPTLSFLVGIAIAADWWALKQADVSWLPAFGYAVGIGILMLTPIAAPIYYFHRP